MRHEVIDRHTFGGKAEGWVEAVIEIPRGSRNKIEFDHERGIFRLDRVLYSSVHYPTDYGFLEETLSLDGDPLDVLVVVNVPTFSGCHVHVRPVGTLMMIDEHGKDEKILELPHGDPRFHGIGQLRELPAHWQREIATFFATYKELQGLQTEVRDWHDVDVAWRVIEEARQRYRDLKA